MLPAVRVGNPDTQKRALGGFGAFLQLGDGLFPRGQLLRQRLNLLCSLFFVGRKHCVQRFLCGDGLELSHIRSSFFLDIWRLMGQYY